MPAVPDHRLPFEDLRTPFRGDERRLEEQEHAGQGEDEGERNRAPIDHRSGTSGCASPRGGRRSAGTCGSRPSIRPGREAGFRPSGRRSRPLLCGHAESDERGGGQALRHRLSRVRHPDPPRASPRGLGGRLAAVGRARPQQRGLGRDRAELPGRHAQHRADARRRRGGSLGRLPGTR